MDNLESLNVKSSQNHLWQFDVLKERILNAVNKNFGSKTYGCCDRAYWGWKTTDFPDLTLQYSILPFGILLNPSSDFETEIFRAMIRFWKNRINKDGSADQSFPRERSAGPSLYVVNAVLSSYPRICELFSEDERSSVETYIRGSLDFSLKSPERYGHVANHKALFAHCYLLAHKIFGDHIYAKAYSREIDEIAARYQEGWFLEYETADPGYQTQCLHYLTLCYQLAQDNLLRGMIVSGLKEFCAYFVFPDGSYSGLFSGRATELFFPYPFSYWAREIDVCHMVLSYLYASRPDVSLVKWYLLDYANFIRLGTNYVLAFPHYKALEPRNDFNLLPCSGEGVKEWEVAGLVVISDKFKHMAVNLKRGGLFKVVSKLNSARIEDTGYSIEHKRVNYTNGIFMHEFSQYSSNDVNNISVRTYFYRVRDQYLDAFKLFVLRFLGFTLLRSYRFTNFLKECMLRSLIFKKKRAPFILHRQIRDEGESVIIQDTIEPQGVTSEFSCSLTETTVPFHMACAGYYYGGPRRHSVKYGFNSKKFRGRVELYTRVTFLTEQIKLERQIKCQEY